MTFFCGFMIGKLTHFLRIVNEADKIPSEKETSKVIFGLVIGKLKT